MIRILTALFVLLLVVPAFAEGEKSEVVTVPAANASTADLMQRLVKTFCEEGMVDDGDHHLLMPDGSCPAVGGP